MPSLDHLEAEFCVDRDNAGAEGRATKPRHGGATDFSSRSPPLAGSTITIAIGLIAIFLLVHAIPSLRANHANFFTSAQFDTADSNNLAFGIRDLFMVTVLSSLCAMALAVPVAIGIAVFLTQYAPARLSRPFGALVDLLAAVPSIVFGLWGIFVLAPQVSPIEAFLNRHLGWLFLFKAGNVSLAGGGNILTAGVVLSVMVLPIITSVSREVFRQTPGPHIEAAQALGATKWEVVRMTVLPFGRSGVVAASMLGLGSRSGRNRGGADHPARGGPPRELVCFSTVATPSRPRLLLRQMNSVNPYRREPT